MPQQTQESDAVTHNTGDTVAAPKAAPTNGLGGPNGSISTKSYRDSLRRSDSSPTWTTAVRLLRRRFSRINRVASRDRSLKATSLAPTSRAIRIPHAPVAARPSRAEPSGCGHFERTIALRWRFTAIVGL